MLPAQVLVIEDMLGLFPDFTPKFVGRYAELGEAVSAAAAQFAADVRARRFPEPRHCYQGLANGKSSGFALLGGWAPRISLIRKDSLRTESAAA